MLLKRKIDRSIAGGTRAVPDSLGHREDLTGLKNDFAVLELDDQFAFNAEEGLVGMGVMVPGEGVRHHAHADLMIVHRRYAPIVIGLRNLAADLQRIYWRLNAKLSSLPHATVVAGTAKRVQ